MMVVGLSVANAGTLVTFAPPPQGFYVKDGQFTSTLKLTGSADPRTLRVLMGATDVTPFFSPGGCSQAPCTLTATLTPASGMVQGWNTLTARIQGTRGAAETARQQFSYNSGLLGDPTNGSAPGYIVPIRHVLDPVAGQQVLTVMTPTPIVMRDCGFHSTRVVVLNRSTLAMNASLSTCLGNPDVAGYLAQFDQSSIVIVLGAFSGDSGLADFTAIGGSKFGENGVRGYAAIGYGGASPGKAFEAWQDPNDAGHQHYKSISGNLVNLGCTDKYVTADNTSTAPSKPLLACTTNNSNTLYSFLATNATGFAIVPGAAGTPGNPGLPTVYVGNSSNIPFGDSTVPPNQVRPTNSNTGNGLFTNQTYAPQWTGGSAAGGFYLLTLNRSDLTFNSAYTFVTNCNCGDHTNDNAQINALVSNLNQPNPNYLQILTTIGVPFNADTNIAPLLQAVDSLGVSPFALRSIAPDRLGTPAKAGFSMVSYYTPTGPLNSVATAPSGADRLYSSAGNQQQGETGALRGVFAKKYSAYYQAIYVNPFNVSDMPDYATADDYLAHATSFALGTTEAVAWPHMSSTDEQLAYGDISNQLIVRNLFYSDNGTSSQCKANCYDIRFYYTGDQAGNLYQHLTPGKTQYPSGATYSPSVFADVQQQLELEWVYLQEVLAFQAYTKQINSGDEMNVGNALTQSGTNVALTLQNILGTPAKTVEETPAHYAADIFNVIAGVVSLGSAYQGESAPFKIFIAVTSGLNWSISAYMDLVLDNQPVKPTEDPYVNQLQDLISTQSNAASAAARSFNSDMENAHAVFYNGILSDWFRLQSVGLLSVSQGNNGWYVKDTGQDSTQRAYLNSIITKQRTKLWQQILPQYFTRAVYQGVASGWMLSQGKEYHDHYDSALIDVAHQFGTVYVPLIGNPATHDYDAAEVLGAPSYSWASRTSANSPVCQDFVYIFRNQNFGQYWPDALGIALMGTGNGPDGLPNLNVDPQWLYDKWGLPYFEYSSGVGIVMNFPQTVIKKAYDTGDTYPDNVDFACAAHPEPFNTKDQTSVFSNLTPSRTITAGSSPVVFSGTIKAGTAVPTGAVYITIGDVTNGTLINSDGTFSYSWATSSIPPSPTPYVITYSYSGVGGKFTPANDSSTTLTVNSPNTQTEMTVDNSDGIIYGITTTLHAVVRSPAGTPTGTVTFYDAAQSLGSATLANGRADLSLSGFTGGSHSLSAVYSGEGVYQPSTSSAFILQVGQTFTVMTSLAFTTPVTYGTPNLNIVGQFQAGNVYPLTDGAIITITIGGIAKQATISGGQGAFSYTFPIASLAPGTYTVRIDYAGDANFMTMYDTKHQLQINKVAPTFGTLAVPAPISAGYSPTTLSGTVIGQSNLAPTGTVTASINGKTGNPGVLTNGAFKLDVDTSALPASSSPYTITYQYSGDTYYTTASNNSTALTVNAVQTTTSLTASALTADVGAKITFTAAVSGAAAGSVSFYDGTTQLGTATLANGAAVFSTTALAIGSHTIRATYDAGGNSGSSTSADLQVTINALTSAFSNLTSTPAVTNGAVDLSGVIAAVNSRTDAVAAGGAPTIDSSVGISFNLDPTGITTDASTFSVWIKTTEKGIHNIFQTPNINPCIYHQNDQIGVYWNGAGADGVGFLSLDTTPITDGQWHHIAVSFNKGQITFYKDGKPTSDNYSATTSAGSTNQILLGGGGYQHNTNFLGEMWNAKVWATPSAQADIQADMYQQNYGSPLPASLRLLSSFNANTNSGSNLVNGVAANFVAFNVNSDNVPFAGQYPAQNETVAITINNVKQNFPVGVNGAFSAHFTVPALTPANYQVEYNYAGNAALAPAADRRTALSVFAPTAPTITLTSSTGAANLGTPVTLTASVTSAAGVPTGSVTFSDGTAQLGRASLKAGVATVTTASLSIGDHQISAAYDGANPSYLPGTSTPIKVTINGLTTAFTNLTPSQSVDSGTASINVSGIVSAAGLAVRSDAVAKGTDPTIDDRVGTWFNLDPTGLTTASSTFSVWIKTTEAGKHNIFQTPNINPCIYHDGDRLGVFWNGAGNDQIGWVSTDTTPITDGQWHHIAVSFDQGRITFYKDGKPTSDSFTIGAGINSDPQIVLGGGGYQHLTNFLGEMWNAKVWATASAQVDVQADMYQTYGTAIPAALKVLSSFNSGTNEATNVANGTPASVVHVNMVPDSLPSYSQYPAAGEQVTVAISGATKSFTLDQSGNFSGAFPVATIAAGTSPIQYSYAGNAVLAAASDQTTALTIKSVATSTTTTLTASASTAELGATVKFTATVSPTAATGNVLFYSDGTLLGSVALSQGAATYSTNSLTLGAHSITAAYDGSTNYAKSTSVALTVQITKVTPVFSQLTASPTMNYGDASINLGGKITASNGPVTGSVTVTLNNAPKTASIGSDGTFSATFDTSTLAVNTYSITYSFAATDSLNAVTDNSTKLTVLVGSTTTTVTSSALTVDYGTAVTFTSVVASKNGVPTGTVTFFDNGTALGSPVKLTAGSAMLSTSSLGAGTHAITASYTSDSSSFTNSTSAAITETINKLTPVFSGLSSPTAKLGTVTLNGKIAAGSQIPIGTVSVTVGNGAPVSASIQSDGSFTANFDASKLAAGTYPVTYAYAPSGNFNGATDSTTTLTVQDASTTTTVTSSALTVDYGTAVTFTATVAGKNGVPTGTVTFFDNGTALGSPVKLAAGSATLSTSSLATGLHTITASYASDSSSFTNSTSPAITETINKLTPMFSGLSSPTVKPGTVTLNGKIAAGNQFPSGLVSVTVGNSAPVSANIQADGSFTANFDASKLAAGTYPVTYAYAASGNFNGATDSTTTLTVQDASTTTTVTSSALTVDYGTAVTFTATVAGKNGVPTGTITFFDNGTALGSPVRLTAGSATLSTSSLAAGTHTITASYASDSSNFANSTSAAITENINKLTPVFSGLSAPAVKPGTVTLSGKIAAGSQIPNGLATVKVGNAAPLSANIASDGSFTTSFDASTLAPGTYPIVYSYAGGGNFNGATSSTTLTVNSNGPVVPTLLLVANPNPAVEGQTVTFTATVVPVGNIVPTGNVTISEPLPDGTVLIYGNADLVNGVATIVVDKNSSQQISAGTHTNFFATYGGDAGNVNYMGATSAAYKLVVESSLGEVDGNRKAALKISVMNSARSGDQVTVNLKIENIGAGALLDANITDVVVKALIGQGTPTVFSRLPIPVGPLAPAASIVRALYLTVPTSVQQISLTESGTLRDATTASAPFTVTQAITLP